MTLRPQRTDPGRVREAGRADEARDDEEMAAPAMPDQSLTDVRRARAAIIEREHDVLAGRPPRDFVHQRGQDSHRGNSPQLIVERAPRVFVGPGARAVETGGATLVGDVVIPDGSDARQ